jgi:hypothetical protein
LKDPADQTSHPEAQSQDPEGTPAVYKYKNGIFKLDIIVPDMIGVLIILSNHLKFGSLFATLIHHQHVDSGG